jgi:MshEN domain
MADKLGQLLLEQRLITQEQLDETLKSQAIFGGRLGSHLVENGILDEITLAKALGQQHRVPFAHSIHFHNLPEDLLLTVSRNLAEKYLVLPLKQEKKRLYLAMPDPGDLAAIEEIGFRTGLVVRPVVAPESVIAKNLKQHYGINWIGRYIKVEEEPRERPAEKRPLPPKDDPASWLGGPEAESMMAAWEQSAQQKKPETGRPGPGETAPQAVGQPKPLECLGEKLTQNLDREVMADLVINALAAEVGTAALLLVRGDTAIGWRAVRDGQPVSGYDLIQVGLNQPSVLQTVSLSKAVFLGAAPDLPANRQFLETLNCKEQVLIVPIMLLGRLIGMICVANPKLNLQSFIGETRKIALMLAIGLEMLILKNKLTSL